MGIVVIEKLTGKDVEKAREEYTNYIKITADISREIVAIGGEYHADAEEILVKDFKCENKNIWGGGYNVKLRKFETNAVLNIKPLINDSTEIINQKTRENFLNLTREKLEDIEKFL
jgi:hypothetical protein